MQFVDLENGAQRFGFIFPPSKHLCGATEVTNQPVYQIKVGERPAA